MSGHRFIFGNLINADLQQALFLTLALLIALTSRHSHADPLPAETANANKQQVSQTITYIRARGLETISVMPQEVRDTVKWFSSGAHELRWPLDDDEPTLTPGPDQASAPVGSPEQISLSDPHQAPVGGLSYNFHHKGFLPTHDALLIGHSFSQSILDDKLQFTLRPFIGQSWRCLSNYWGSEASLNIAQRPDGLPWGKISLGYVQGDEQMTDHGRGMELRGDVDLTNNFKFTSGIRQDSITGDSNYVMVRWRINLD